MAVSKEVVSDLLHQAWNTHSTTTILGPVLCHKLKDAEHRKVSSIMKYFIYKKKLHLLVAAFLFEVHDFA